ncbi:MAG: hypothetical protein IK090_02780 [Clostridia bacterium]|nr:hypothetical protein [Clostridia bacterium]
MKTEKAASFAARVAALLLLCLLLFACPLAALCAEGDGESGPAATDTEAAATGTGAGVNFSETVSSFLDRYAGEIFSALSLAGTILLAWLARRGLLPAMRAGLDGLAAGVDRLNDCARDAGERQSRLLSDLLADAEPVLRDLSGMRDLFAALSERTAELEKKTAEAAGENEKLLALNRAAVEMLKEVFTAAKLPVTSKEELAAIYRRALDAAGDGGEVEP